MEAFLNNNSQSTNQREGTAWWALAETTTSEALCDVNMIVLRVDTPALH